jgi:hypothetical protein
LKLNFCKCWQPQYAVLKRNLDLIGTKSRLDILLVDVFWKIENVDCAITKIILLELFKVRSTSFFGKMMEDLVAGDKGKTISESLRQNFTQILIDPCLHDLLLLGCRVDYTEFDRPFFYLFGGLLGKL